MTEQDPAPGEHSDEHPDPKVEAERRRRRAQVFGDVLPESTRDDIAADADDTTAGSDEWLRRQKPPHHG